MITNEFTMTYSEQYLLSRGISPKDSLFFDIETTGFRADYSHLYLIGAAFRAPKNLTDESINTEAEEPVWIVRQWLAEYPQEETKLLRTFAEFLKSFDTILHFNGKRFDIPYLEEKYGQYDLQSPFEGKNSVDLYQEVRPLKSFLKLEHMNQKSLEVFLGLERCDQYDGGKLIAVYREFCKTKDPQKLQLLLLHNQEDVSGMFTLTRLYGYLDFFSMAETSEEAFEDFSVELVEKREESKELLVTFSLKTPVPVTVSYSGEYAYVILKKNTGKLLVSFLEDTLYYFFTDYKNYYYLPQEDQAIHKSVAAYVDKQYRQQAKKENCYTRSHGWFLPQPEGDPRPAFRRSYQDPMNWLLWKEEEWAEPEVWKQYLRLLIRSFLK